jgi:hypothetical protein
LEDFLARIDAPLLDNLVTVFFNQLTFDIPRLTQFVGRAPKLNTHNQARVVFSDVAIWVTLPQTCDERLELSIACKRSDWQLSSMTQLCSSSFRRVLIPAVEHLYIQSGLLRLRWQDDIESGQWLEFFHLFTSVKDLYISQEFTPRVAPALQELVGERVTEVLPALQTIFLEGTLPTGPAQEYIGQFVAARRLVGHPVGVSLWERRKQFE